MPYSPIDLSDFSGGLNTASIAAKIADNQLTKCLNMEYDPTGTAISTRRGSRLTPFGSTVGYTTSLFGFLRSSRIESQLIKSMSNGDIYGQDATIATQFNKLNDAITLSPTKTQWYWATFTNLAIGVNGDTVNVNPFKWNGTDGDGAQLGGTAPKGKYIATWNSRVWIAKDNTLYFSKLGDAENWTATGVSGAGSIEVGYNDGDLITGLAAHGERLFVFKRNHIYQIITANPNTDPTIWRLELLTKDGGCISHGTIQPFGADLIFLSDEGVVSLNAMNIYAPNFTRSIISRYINVPTQAGRTNYVSIVLPGALPGSSQYMLFTGEGSRNWRCHVMDIMLDTPIGPQGRWVQFEFRQRQSGADLDGGPFGVGGAAICYTSAGKQYVVLGSDGFTADTLPHQSWVITYPVEASEGYRDCMAVSVGSSYGISYDSEFRSKAYAMGSSLVRKGVHKIGWAGSGLLSLLDTSSASVDFYYRFDQDETKQKTNTVKLIYGSLTESKDFAKWFRASGFPGRRFNEIQVGGINNQTESPYSGFTFKEALIKAIELSERHANLE